MIANYHHKLVITVLLFISVIISGVILHRTGKPYPPVVFNVHKLLTVAWVILMVILVRSQCKVSVPDLAINVSLVVSVLGLLALFFSGGTMSLDRLQEPMLTIHRVASLTLLITVPFVLYSMSCFYSKIF